MPSDPALAIGLGAAATTCQLVPAAATAGLDSRMYPAAAAVHPTVTFVPVRWIVRDGGTAATLTN